MNVSTRSKAMLSDCLVDAATQGDVQELEKWLSDTSVDVNECGDTSPITPICAAFTALLDRLFIRDWTNCSHFQCIKLLIDKGANVNLPFGEFSGTPLILAIKKRQKNMISFLIEAGADVNGSDIDGTSPLMTAAEVDDVELAESLLDHGADVNSKMLKGDNAVIFANCFSNDCLRLFVDRGADVNTLHLGRSLTLDAALMKNDSMVAWLLQRDDTLINISILSLVDERLLNRMSDDGAMLLFCAGEQLTITWRKRMSKVLLDDNCPSLKCKCRRDIRGALLAANTNGNLFTETVKIGLPNKLVQYLLYYVDLNKFL